MSKIIYHKYYGMELRSKDPEAFMAVLENEFGTPIMGWSSSCGFVLDMDDIPRLEKMQQYLDKSIFPIETLIHKIRSNNKIIITEDRK